MTVSFINISHLHPLLVHLPIGILVLLFILEVLLRKTKSDESHRILLSVLLIAFVSSILSLFTGWQLGNEGGYEGNLLKLHKWTAVALTVALGILYVLKIKGREKLNKFYWFLLVSILILLTITGHYGASMTHGENFLFQHKEPLIIEISDVNEATVYSDIIRPIFENNCVSCHNTCKSNGGLIMSSKEALLKGGKSGDFFSVSGDASLLERIHLPLDDKKHMPPNGKVQLSEEQLFYLEWWMENDHCFDCKVKDLKPTDADLEKLRLLEADKSRTALLERELNPLNKSWLQELVHEGISFYPLEQSSKLISVNLNQSKTIRSVQMNLLAEYGEHVVELNIAGTDFSDELSSYLSEFKNLIKLNLSNTLISDKTTSEIADLEYLESVNLYGTSVTKTALEELAKLPAVQSIYAWQTDITSEEIKAFQKEFPSIELIGQFESPLLAESQLEQPEVKFSRTLFEDTVKVQLSTDFDGAWLYYTLDGTRPDTTSFLFKDEIVINQSSVLSVIAFKEGWGSSEPISETFKQLTIPVKSADIKGELHENYQAQKGNSINYGIIASLDFKDGKWLGFQGVSPEFVLELDKAQTISNVSVSAMSAQPSWIFYPKGFTVYVSNNNTSWEKVHYSSYASVKQQPETEKQFFDLRFEEVQAKYIKVELESPLELPHWHASPGEPCYVFVDEILVE